MFFFLMFFCFLLTTQTVYVMSLDVDAIGAKQQNFENELARYKDQLNRARNKMSYWSFLSVIFVGGIGFAAVGYIIYDIRKAKNSVNRQGFLKSLENNKMG